MGHDLVVLPAHLRPALDGEALILRAHAVGGHEVGQGAIEVFPERHLCRQRRLEENFRLAVAVVLPDVLARGLLVVAAVRLRLTDSDDAIAPRLLSGHDHLLCHLLARSGEWHRRVVQVDADVALRVQEVAEGVLDLHVLALWSREVVVAHSGGGAAMGHDLVVLPAHLRPALDGEALVLRAYAIGGHEVGQGAVEVFPERDLIRQGRLEEDGHDAVPIVLPDVIARGLLVVAAVRLDVADRHDAIAPRLLSGYHLFLRYRLRRLQLARRPD